MNILRSVKAVFEEKPQLINPVVKLRKAEKYIFILPENEFFLYLMLEPLLNIEKKLISLDKKVIFLTDRESSDISHLFNNALVEVDLSDKNSVKTIKRRLFLLYKNSIYINFDFTGNTVGKYFKSSCNPLLSISVGNILQGYDISLVYRNHYDEFLQSLYAIFCIKKKNLSGFLRLRKSGGKGICINQELFERYRGEKIMKPSVLNIKVPIPAGDLAKIINKSEFVVSYMDRIAAIGYLLQKKVICVTDKVTKLPDGIDISKGEGGEIDYFIN